MAHSKPRYSLRGLWPGAPSLRGWFRQGWVLGRKGGRDIEAVAAVLAVYFICVRYFGFMSLRSL